MFIYIIFFVCRVIVESGNAAQHGDQVKRLIFCSGKVYYDLKSERQKRNMVDEVALTRIEQVLYNNSYVLLLTSYLVHIN